MKKILSLLLAMTLVITMSAGAVFANETSVPEIADVAGTPYGTAVNSLVQAGIVDGYPDGTYRPEDPVSRAEACKLIYETYATDGASQAYDPSQTFSDLLNYDWASQYIGWAHAEGIVIGDGNGNFRPGDSVNVNEFLTMLIRAGGFEKPDMVWPDDYVDAAAAQGLTETLVDIELPADGKAPASRGNCAIMIFETGLVEEVHPDAPDAEEGILSDFSGRAFGFILENGKVLNPDDEVVDMVTFKMGVKEFTLMAKPGKFITENGEEGGTYFGPENGLMCLQMSNGEVISAKAVYDPTDVQTFDGESCMLTVPNTTNGALDFYKVTYSDDNFIYYDTGISEPDVNYLPLNNQVVVYNCSYDGEIVYEAESYYGQVYEECYVAAFTLNGEDSDLADVIIVVDPADLDVFNHAPKFNKVS